MCVFLSFSIAEVEYSIITTARWRGLVCSVSAISANGWQLPRPVSWWRAVVERRRLVHGGREAEQGKCQRGRYEYTPRLGLWDPSRLIRSVSHQFLEWISKPIRLKPHPNCFYVWLGFSPNRCCLDLRESELYSKCYPWDTVGGHRTS